VTTMCEEATMTNQRRRFLGIAAGVLAAPTTTGLAVAQGARPPGSGRTGAPERRPATAGVTGLSALMTPEESVVVLIDHQPFQFANLHSHEPTMIVNNVIGLAKFAKTFKVPVILTTVLAARGGKIIQGLQDVFPEQQPIDRTYINAWQDQRIVDLVKQTGRKKLILAALWTEMCLAMPAIHALGDGYDVYVVTDASGGVSLEAHDMAVRRMVQAGIVPITWIALSGEWQRDWARESTLPETVKIIAEHGGGSGVAFAWEFQLLATGKR
jgi:nicotinamidase-related amidase